MPWGMPVAVIFGCFREKRKVYLSFITKQLQIQVLRSSFSREQVPVTYSSFFCCCCEIVIAVLIHLECIATWSLYSHYVEVKLSKVLKPLFGLSTNWPRRNLDWSNAYTVCIPVFQKDKNILHEKVKPYIWSTFNA